MDSVMDGVPHKTDQGGNPNVFTLEENDDGLWLNNNWAKLDNEWNPGNTFVFRLRNCFLFRGLTRRGFSFPDYSDFSSSHRAINRFREYARTVSRNHTRTVWVLKCDIRKFFANIDHAILEDILRRRVGDADVVRLLREVVGSFHTKDKPCVGLPLGNLTSQLLVNIYMNEFDHFLKRALIVIQCVRYADDFVILHERKGYVENLLPKISAYLQTRLKLSLHPDKVFIKTIASGVDFLGWVHFPHHRVPSTTPT